MVGKEAYHCHRVRVASMCTRVVYTCRVLQERGIVARDGRVMWGVAAWGGYEEPPLVEQEKLDSVRSY